MSVDSQILKYLPEDYDDDENLLKQGGSLTAAWMKRYKELKEFYHKHGHSNVPNDFHQNPQDVYAQLGRWIAKQRYNYKLFAGEIVSDKYKTLMTEEKIKLLDAIDFRWEKESKRWKSKAVLHEKQAATSWNDRFNELNAYSKDYGDCMVPYKYPPNVQLGRWVSVQRYMYNELQKGKKSSMTPERIDMLKSIGFTWDASEKSFGGKEFVSHKKKSSASQVENRPAKQKRLSNGNKKMQKKSKNVDSLRQSIHIDGMIAGESIFDQYILKMDHPHRKNNTECTEPHEKCDNDESKGFLGRGSLNSIFLHEKEDEVEWV